MAPSLLRGGFMASNNAPMLPASQLCSLRQFCAVRMDGRVACIDASRSIHSIKSAGRDAPATSAHQHSVMPQHHSRQWRRMLASATAAAEAFPGNAAPPEQTASRPRCITESFDARCSKQVTVHHNSQAVPFAHSVCASVILVGTEHAADHLIGGGHQRAVRCAAPHRPMATARLD
jgi:hypothetical protein